MFAPVVAVKALTHAGRVVVTSVHKLVYALNTKSFALSPQVVVAKVVEYLGLMFTAVEPIWYE